MATKKRKKKKKKERTLPASAVIMIAALVLMGLSIAFRWSGIGKNLSVPEVPFQLEVLNGTGEQGVAREVTMKLRKMGIDVLIEGNAGRFDYRETVLVDRKGNPDLMMKLSRRLGVSRVLKQVQDRPHVDATLIIGWDRERLRLQQ
jgi:hypothetical protein